MYVRSEGWDRRERWFQVGRDLMNNGWFDKYFSIRKVAAIPSRFHKEIGRKAVSQMRVRKVELVSGANCLLVRLGCNVWCF